MNFSQVLQDIRDIEDKSHPYNKRNHSHEAMMEILARLGKEWEDVPIGIMADCIKYIESAFDYERNLGYENGLEDSYGRAYQ